MREVLALVKKEKKIQNITNGVKGAAIVGVAGAGVYVGYLGVLAFVSVKDEMAGFWETITGAPAALWNWQAGSKTCKDPETGVEYQCPKSHNGVENPLSGWPIVGGLFNLGMWVGNTETLRDMSAPATGPPVGPEPPADWVAGPSWVQEEAEAAAAAAEAQREEEEQAAADAAAAAALQAEIDAQEAAGMPCPGAPRPDLPCNHRLNRGF